MVWPWYWLEGSHNGPRLKARVIMAVGRSIGETGAQWIRNLLFQYITDPVRATGIF